MNSCIFILLFFFFFKQKTAYEMLRSLVGSEMCIRDSLILTGPRLSVAHAELLLILSTLEDTTVHLFCVLTIQTLKRSGQCLKHTRGTSRIVNGLVRPQTCL